MFKSNAVKQSLADLFEAVLAAPTHYGRALQEALLAIAPPRSAHQIAESLRYDIGESDCRPMPGNQQDKARAAERQSFEAMKLRGF